MSVWEWALVGIVVYRIANAYRLGRLPPEVGSQGSQKPQGLRRFGAWK